VPVSRMKTQTDQIQESLSTEFTFTRLLLAFAGFALFRRRWIGRICAGAPGRAARAARRSPH